MPAVAQVSQQHAQCYCRPKLQHCAFNTAQQCLSTGTCEMLSLNLYSLDLYSLDLYSLDL
jgi:hypothetical protein